MANKQKTLSLLPFIGIYLGVIAVCVALDQLTKYLIVEKMLGCIAGNSQDILGKFLQFTVVFNEGSSFGMGQDDKFNVVFLVVTIIGLPMFGFLLLRSRTRSIWGQIGFAFIIGGTIGNAIDRSYFQATDGFFTGAVRDFISFSIFPPVFNVADSFLVVGVFMSILAIVVFDPDGLVAEFAKEKAEKLRQKEQLQEVVYDSQQVEADGEETVVEQQNDVTEQQTESLDKYQTDDDEQSLAEELSQDSKDE